MYFVLVITFKGIASLHSEKMGKHYSLACARASAYPINLLRESLLIES